MLPSNGSLLTAPPFPPAGPGEPSSPLFAGTMKALRLPIRVSTVAYLVRSRRPRDPPGFVSATRSRQGGDSCRAGPLGSRQVPSCRRCSRVDANGISQVSRRSILCLCSVPRPRSSRRALAICRSRQCCPRYPYGDGLGRRLISGLTPQLRHLLPYASRVTLPHTCKACFRLAWLSLCREGVEPSGPLREVSAHGVLLSCPPDANGFRR